ncbi:hypothetical protein SEVIR_6G258501v4 [Setaria viridis]|nr:hypothetical protein SEVIR_6G258501v2 [Setaria viridis]
MDGAANWRPTQGADPAAVAAAGGVDPNAAAPAGGDWRTQLQPEARSRIVNKIMETLKKHLPVSVPEGLSELQKIAVRFEEKIYTAATNQSDYLRKISLKMLSMENPGNAQVIPNQNPPGPAPGLPPQGTNPAQSSVIPLMSQTGQTGAGDLQEELYQMIKSLKDQYFAELNDLYNKVSMKIQHVDNHMPAQKSSDQYEEMNSFKALLERTLYFLQVNKSSIQPGFREKIPIYERQIVNILNAQRRKPVPAPGQQQFQQSGGQASGSNISQQHQTSQGSSSKGKMGKKLRCHFCKKGGHFKKDCPKKKKWFEEK